MNAIPEMPFDEGQYRAHFRKVTGHDPFDYQVQVARTLLARQNIVLRAPTGAGKTWAVLAPFLFARDKGGPTRLIYALPLRTLAESIFREAQEAAGKLGLRVEGEKDERGRETVPPFVTRQTGEHPDDPFFARGKIIVTTYDQVLSGLLDGPYGLSSGLHNINAAAVVGALVVFDEFHLMEPQKAFLTAVGGLHLFRDLCQSVWMTATATQPLEMAIREALEAVPIPERAAQADEMVGRLPSVKTVTRSLVAEPEPLTAEAVLRWPQGRSLVLLNTVDRAQKMYEALRERLDQEGHDIPIMLLHARFFKQDRQQKEEKLRQRFGKDAKGPAILVATQVVEAGLDLSCDHLHTELCPMNSLVQRAGRCARFENEIGTVHVYPLPAGDRAWLPYGDLRGENVTLTNTRNILQIVTEVLLNPGQVAAWVQQAHGEEDERALRAGWRFRLNELRDAIYGSAVQRQEVGIAKFIRGDEDDTVRVIVCDSPPDRPGRREAIGMSRGTVRGALSEALRSGDGDIGWLWDWAEDEPWKPLRSQGDLSRAYVICMRPSVAAYHPEVGLLLGRAGHRESPLREEPPRPGYAPLREESWVDHARRVAEETGRRLLQEGIEGFLGRGFQNRYGLSPQAVREAAAASGLLHDLGKLQNSWQRWAEAAQRAKHSEYKHRVPLAHTDFDRENPEDWQRERSLGARRPAHAAASAYYAAAFLVRLLPATPQEKRGYMVSACMAAVLAHHGGWLGRGTSGGGMGLGIDRLCPGWEGAVAAALGSTPDIATVPRLEREPDKQQTAERGLGHATSPERLLTWWPLVASLTRTLRLSDQRATAEGAMDD